MSKPSSGSDFMKRAISRRRSALKVQNGSFFAGASGPTASPNFALSFWWICSGESVGMERLLGGRPLLVLLLLAPDDVLDPQQALREGFGPGRTAGDVDVDRDHLVDALGHRI